MPNLLEDLIIYPYFIEKYCILHRIASRINFRIIFPKFFPAQNLEILICQAYFQE